MVRHGSGRQLGLTFVSQVVFTQLIDRIQAPNNDATKSIILVHRRELVDQAATHCSRAYSEKSIEIEMGDSHASGEADITIASVRSLASSKSDRLDKYDPAQFKLVLVDEAHHIVAPSYLTVLEHFGLREPNMSQCALVGVSATMGRLDGLKLGAAIDHIVYHKDYVEMIDLKWLSNVIFTTVKSNADLSRVRTGKTGDFLAGSLSRAVNTDEINDISVGAWRSEAGTRESTIVFCVDINHVKGLTNSFRKHGVDAQYITGDTPAAIRAERLAAFKNREFPVLVNCGIFTEGTDIPNIDCVLLARPTKSRNLLVQMIGRGMRLFSGKQDCHVIDMVGSLETGIVTVPTLFGLDPSEVVHEADSAKMKELQGAREKELESQLEQNLHSTRLSDSGGKSRPDISLTMTRYDSVVELIDDTSGERHIRAMSIYAWVQVDNDRYILSSPSGFIDIHPLDADDPAGSAENAPRYEIAFARALPEWSKVPYAKTRIIGNASNLSDAVRAADTFATAEMERVFILTSSEWRKRPASEGQLKALNKKFGTAEEPLNSQQLSKGKAADMLTKLKHGAKKRFSRIKTWERKTNRIEAKLEDLRRRETVEVGPVEGSLLPSEWQGQGSGHAQYDG